MEGGTGMISETSKWRHLTGPYCKGNGVDIGSGGDPVVAWAIQVDLPDSDYAAYNQSQPRFPIQWRGDCRDLPFKNGTLDFIYTSHLIEDFPAAVQFELIRKWAALLKPGGYLVILAPDRERWAKALAAGQPPNCAHVHEIWPGELTSLANSIGGLAVMHDTLCEPEPDKTDYSILFIARKE